MSIDNFFSKNIQNELEKELKKFVNLYNTLTVKKINLESINYNKFIRILGNFILTKFNKNWSNSTLDLTNCTQKEYDLKGSISNPSSFIDFSLFNSTKYYLPVENFLISLQKVFHTNLDQDIEQYFSSKETEFNEYEKNICLNFYSKMSKLESSMRIQNFSDLTLDVNSKENISGYNDALRDYHEIVLNISSVPEDFEIIERFNKVLKNMIINKKNVIVLLDI